MNFRYRSILIMCMDPDLRTLLSLFDEYRPDVVIPNSDTVVFALASSLSPSVYAEYSHDGLSGQSIVG